MSCEWVGKLPGAKGILEAIILSTVKPVWVGCVTQQFMQKVSLWDTLKLIWSTDTVTDSSFNSRSDMLYLS